MQKAVITMNYFLNPAQTIGLVKPWMIVVFLVWTLIWKGWALWRAARNSHKGWFIVLLILNTVGILEIIYIYGFSKKNQPTSA
jgi:methionyl-tRNA synthetase